MAVNFDIETVTISVGTKGGSLTVRGLNSEDLTFLTLHYLDDMQATVAKFGDRNITDRPQVADVLRELAREFPNMVVEIISRAAEAESADDIAKLRRLSFVKQLEALKAVANLTIEDGGIDLKKALGFVANLLEATDLPPGPLLTSLQTIIATSGRL